MQKVSNKQQSKLVLGLGQTGLSCVRYLSGRGNEVIVYDTRLHPPMLKFLKQQYPETRVYTGLIDETLLSNVDEVLLSPGVNPDLPIIRAARQREIPVFGDVELFARLANAPVIAVTGSNGKSTTVSMIHGIFEHAHLNVRLGGNIGVPVLELLEENEPDFYVLELSSFQLETLESLSAKVAVILNVSEDHMDRYRDLEEYARIKQKICQSAQICLINRDDAWLQQNMLTQLGVKLFTSKVPQSGEYGLLQDAGETWLCFGDEKLMSANELRVKGLHQLSNALAAFAVADMCQIPRDVIRQSLSQFEGLPHRTQFVGEKDGVNYINDSKGTNIGATVAAIEGLSQPIVLIAGGVGKGADFSELALRTKDKIKHLVLIGEDANKISDAFAGSVSCELASDMVDAVSKASRAAVSGDIVLLSPACASFDMFDNYQHRGNVFMEAVGRLVTHEY